MNKGAAVKIHAGDPPVIDWLVFYSTDNEEAVALDVSVAIDKIRVSKLVRCKNHPKRELSKVIV